MKSVSVNALVIRDGRSIKGTLSVFEDEYVFNETKKAVQWDRITCRQGSKKIKAFLFSTMKSYLSFWDGAEESEHYFLEASELQIVLHTVSDFQAAIALKKAEEKARIRQEEEKKRQEEEQLRQQAEEERQRLEEQKRQEVERKRQEDLRKQDILRKRQREQEEHRRKWEEEQNLRKQAEVREQEARNIEFKQRAWEMEYESLMQKEKAESEKQFCISTGKAPSEISVISQKAAAVFLENPYFLLGISSLASEESAQLAADKLQKLSRLHALESYRSPYDLAMVSNPDREISLVQNALSWLQDDVHKLFWFSDERSCAEWNTESCRAGSYSDRQPVEKYDQFLAAYLYALTMDPFFENIHAWFSVFKLYSIICSAPEGAYLQKRFPHQAPEKFMSEFEKNIFLPLKGLYSGEDIRPAVNLFCCIEKYGDSSLEAVRQDVLQEISKWFSDQDDKISYGLKPFENMNRLTPEQKNQVKKLGDTYSATADFSIRKLLPALKKDSIRRDMLVESYRLTTYRLMCIFMHCSELDDMIVYANKTCPYCQEDTQRLIRKSFGFSKIKRENPDIPHSTWDLMGDRSRDGEPPDFEKAFYWYQKAAEAGNMYSMNSLGLCYQKGQGTELNYVMAVKWFRKAADRNHPDGCSNLAECCWNGQGCIKNEDLALLFWEKAANLGSLPAVNRLQSVRQERMTRSDTHSSEHHILIDLGYVEPEKIGTEAVVVLSSPAYVYLVREKEKQNYLQGRKFIHRGGYSPNNTCRFAIKEPGYYYVIVDNGGDSIQNITARANIRNL